MLLPDYFDPNAVAHDLFVDREEERRWFLQAIEGYLRLKDDRLGRAVCITGEKGVGKSILVGSVFHDIRERHSGDTLVVEVDCRNRRSAREVLVRVAQGVDEELRSLKASLQAVPEALIAAVGAIEEIARMTEVELKTAHERLSRFKSVVGLKGRRRLLGNIEAEGGVSFERSDTEIRSLTGKVSFDDARVVGLLCDLFDAIREQGYNVVLHLDNLDELRHEFLTDADRETVRRDIQRLLDLKQAPIALVLSMRLYFCGIVPREVSNRRILKRLGAAHLVEALERRLAREAPAVRAEVGEEPARLAIRSLADRATTALAFMTWFDYVARWEVLDPARLAPALDRFAESTYSVISLPVLRRLASVFTSPDEWVPKERVLEACQGNNAVFEQLFNRQAVLPRDFWHPTEFTLDPELHFLIQPVQGTEAGHAAPPDPS